MPEDMTLPNHAHVDATGLLRLADWARDAGAQGSEHTLAVSLAARGTAMPQSSATADALVSNGHLGVDIIRLAAGEGFAPHTHPGDHLLIVVGGRGTITAAGRVYPTHAGQVYLIAGAAPHAVGAITDHVILAVGAPHAAVDDPERMALVEYCAITAQLGELQCLICGLQAREPTRLHTLGCPHCPCGSCPRYMMANRSQVVTR